MSPCVLEDTQKSQLVMMGQIEVIQGDACARAVLGSCIGLALCDVNRKVSVLAHIVLPAACGRDGLLGKFADTAIPEMLSLLAAHKVTRSAVIAKFAGGAEMFEKLGPMRIGDENTRAITTILDELKIPIKATDVGGNKGRRVSCTASGEYTVEVLGQPLKKL